MFFACFFQGITGFGMALIAAPLLLIFIDKIIVINSFVILGACLNGILLRKIKNPIDKQIFTPLFIASLFGIPIGYLILKIAPINTIKIVAGSLSIFFMLILFTKKIKFSKIKLITPTAGFISGLLQTSIGISGPPVVILLSGLNQEKNIFRKTLAAFFFYMNIVSIVLFLITGSLTFAVFKYNIWALPFVFLGAYLGDKIAQKIPQRIFNLLVIITIIITGLTAILSGLS